MDDALAKVSICNGFELGLYQDKDDTFGTCLFENGKLILHSHAKGSKQRTPLELELPRHELAVLLMDSGAFETAEFADEALKKLSQSAREAYDAFTEKLQNQEYQKQADILIQLVQDSDTDLFFDQYSTPHVAIPVKGHREVWPIKSTNFKRWLSRVYWTDTGTACNSTALQSALSVLEAIAVHDGEQKELHNRVAAYDNAIYYDLSDPQWRAVRIDQDGWEIVEKPPVFFKRFSHQSPQVEPTSGGDIKCIFDYINLKDDEEKILFLSYLVHTLIPDIPHAIPVVHGAQGSAKSSLAHLCKKIVDPSQVVVFSGAKNQAELIQLLSHHWLCPFDNMSSLPRWMSDLFCRAVTGDGFSKRELYSDDDDIIYSFKRCIFLNGINVIATRPDLLDRSILIGLERISKKNRRTEKELWTQFERDRPAILGSIFDTLSQAMRFISEIDLDEKPRMADFAIWGEAISRAIGNEPGVFITAYFSNLRKQNLEALVFHAIGGVVLKIMEEREIWNGYTSELLGEMNRLSEELKIDTSAKEWPKAANVLTRRLNELKINLEEEGILVSIGREDGTNLSLVTLTNIKNKSTTSTPPQNAGDSGASGNLNSYVTQAGVPPASGGNNEV